MRALLVAVFLFAPMAQAQEPELSRTEYWNLGVQFAKCSGMYAAFSETLKAADKPASALQANNTHNGWHIASMFLFSFASDGQRSRDQIERAVESYEATAKASVASLIEFDDKERLQAFSAPCEELSDMQTELVEGLRGMIHGKPESQSN